MTTSNSTNTTSLFTNAAAAGYLPIRGLKGVCARIKCLADGCSEQAFIFRNNEGKVINACTCGWKRWAPAPKKWGKTVVKTPHVNEALEAAFAIKKAAALAAVAIRTEKLREESAQDAKDGRGTKSLALLGPDPQIEYEEACERAMVEFKPDMS